MKIVHLYSSFSNGGIENLIYSICAEGDLREDIQIWVVIVNKLYSKDLLKKLTQTRAKIVLLGRPPGNPWNIIWYTIKLRKLLLSIRPTILHYHDDLSAFVGFFSSLFLRIPRFYTLHCTRLYSIGFNCNLLFKYLAINTTNKFIAISRSVKDDFLKKFTTNGDKIVVISNGIDLDKFNPVEKQNNITNIICVARLNNTEKGQDILIKSLSIIKKRFIAFQCQMVGEGPSRFVLEQMINKFGLNHEVVLLGERNDISDLLPKADLLVLPSRIEGFGLAIIEAMASGVAVIASNIDGPKEIIQHYITGLLFESENEEDLANNLEILIKNNKLRSRLVINSLLEVKKYSIKLMFDKYIDLYNQCI